MNSNEQNPETTDDTNRPLGYWLRVVGATIGRERFRGAERDDIRSRIEAAVSPEDYATTVASLEAIAREFGWDETRAEEWRKGRGPRFGFGPGMGRGFGPEQDDADGPRHPHHRGHGPHGHGHHGRGRGREHAYERGFDAGFQRGRESAAA